MSRIREAHNVCYDEEFRASSRKRSERLAYPSPLLPVFTYLGQTTRSYSLVLDGGSRE